MTRRTHTAGRHRAVSRETDRRHATLGPTRTAGVVSTTTDETDSTRTEGADPW
ncbi:hypothetical protein RYH80_10005 [Halobaculum sp. MBLA0147]|uniref:hypothetical protein n=1 Tax=Halobaculum sp. MBLA0147 TaxID=3079934 RepID=UPI00352530E2